jgi:hypothetical protein
LLRKFLTPREADDIANLAFIGGKTNRQISDKAPDLYFPQLFEKVGTGPFAAQCIPTAPALLMAESYKAFLLERRRMISQRLNDFLGTDNAGA